MFRPVRTVHFALLRALGGRPEPQAWIFHLANLLWHMAAAILLYSVAWRLLAKLAQCELAKARLVALFVGLAFAVHPVTSEVVCWAKSLDDLLAAAFVLASLRTLLQRTGSTRTYLAALGWFALALYAKESAVPFALAVVLVARLYYKKSWKHSLLFSSGFMAVAALYVVHRRLVLGQTAQCAPLSGSYGQTLLDMLPVVTKYFRLLCGLPPFLADYSFMHGHNPFSSSEVLLGLGLLLAATIAAVWLWRKQPVGAFGLLWLGLFLLPVSNLLPMMQYMAERFLYMPLLGFLLLLGCLVARIPRPRLATLTASVLALLWVGASLQQAPVWKDELTLFTHSWFEGGRSARLEKNMAVAIFRLPHVQKLFPIDPDTEALRMADTITAKDAEPIVQTLEQARAILPNNTVIVSALGLTYARLGRAKPAVETLEAATTLAPSSPQQWLNLGMVAMAFQDQAKARKGFEHVLRLDPVNPEAIRYYKQLSQAPPDVPAN
jgi:tetratricopeptide (TPR) repeat protein